MSVLIKEYRCRDFGIRFSLLPVEGRDLGRSLLLVVCRDESNNRVIDAEVRNFLATPLTFWINFEVVESFWHELEDDNHGKFNISYLTH